ncbi:regulatory protein RecX [Psychrosphaera ytuae]|uniref:Regulatory protein RecX n=1 Tax=Psychrosphaera ytuae TaxID=2820710 RepID=A0A975HJD4_9GAMM|nr:regulatory protein RecX [Psychrosphaera ytuae]QTH65202.1 regulatory protein RecX [Psychrosphaera ytuae]
MGFNPAIKYDPITDPKKLYNRALYWLSKRDYSISDFQKKLDKVCEDERMKSELLERLIENDWLSEERYILAFIRSKTSAGLGPYRIINDLKQHGVKSQDAEPHLDAQTTDWFEQAKETYQRKYGRSEIGDHKERAKRFRYMQYRGFSIDQINYAMSADDELA